MTNNNINTRRNFLKKTALASLAVTLPQCLTAFENERFFKEEFNAALSPKMDKNLVFLFQGDSITDGNRGRNTDPNHIMGHGYAFSIASRAGADFPEKKLTFYNRGISGNKVSDLASRWQKDTLDLNPDVLSILIGINDSSMALKDPSLAALESYTQIYRSLLEQAVQKNPEILFVLCEPFVLPAGKEKENWEARCQDLQQRQKIVKSLASEFKAVFVPFQSVFDKALVKAPAAYWIWDGIHPTVAGHELMAREWIKQVSKRLKFLR